MQKENEIVIIDPIHIHPHPKNPRQDLGDLTELTESVKKNGIMQNLTIIPIEDEPGEYMALIGHRRSAAAREAKLTGVPCRIIEGLSEKEQVGIMLEENMQRNDLTIYEQAHGFQMMLDLGETAETIAEKTGFSTTTVYHRLNIAKLNQNTLQKREKENGFQLSLTDLYELEAVKDIRTRNKILKEAYDSKNLVQRARNAAKEEKRDKNAEEVIKLFKKLKEEVKEAPKNLSVYDSRYERVKEIDIDKEVPKNIKLTGKGPFFYIVSYGTLYILKKKEIVKKKKTKEELEREQQEKNKKEIKAIVKNMDKRCRQFVLDIVSGVIKPVKEENEIKDLIWACYMNFTVNVGKHNCFLYYTNEKQYYNCTEEEKQEANEWVNSLSTIHQMLVILYRSLAGKEFYTYTGKYNQSLVNIVREGYRPLEKYGWFFTEEEQQLLDGTHELYCKPKENS